MAMAVRRVDRQVGVGPRRRSLREEDGPRLVCVETFGQRCPRGQPALLFDPRGDTFARRLHRRGLRRQRREAVKSADQF